MTMPEPTGVSGPGAMSQRVDKQPMRDVTGLPYGQGQQMQALQQAAPMAATPPIPPPPKPSAPSTRPNEPVTHGADAGPGADSSILTRTQGVPSTGGAISQAIAQAAATDPSGQLAQLLVAAQQKGL